MVVEAGDLKVTVERPASWARRLTITVPAGRVERERRSATQRIARQIKLPGFRKGKIPAHVLEKRFGPAIEQQAIERVVGEAYREALEKEGLEPITQGAIDQIDYAAGTDLTFQVDLEVRPEIELERLGGFTVKRPAVTVTDAEIDRVVEQLREQQAAWTPVEGESPAAGDRAVLEIIALTDEGEQGEPRRYEIVLGSDQAAPAIEDAVRTLEPGTESEFDIELPADPNRPDSQVEQHHVRIRLVEAKRPELPVVDDDFAQGLGEFDSLEALRSRIRDDLEREAGQEADASVRQALLSNVVDANPFDIPSSMVAQYLSSLVPDQEDAPADDLERARQSARPYAEAAIKRALIVQRVADLESLRATREEVDARIDTIANRLDRPAGVLRAQLERNDRLREIEDEITESKVFDYLKTLSTIEQA